MACLRVRHGFVHIRQGRSSTWFARGDLAVSTNEFEVDLMRALDEHDRLVRQVVDGALPMRCFMELYGGFYQSFALDGHEATASERAVLFRYARRIEVHSEISRILGSVCSDEDADKPAYVNAGRYNAEAALTRMRAHVGTRWT